MRERRMLYLMSDKKKLLRNELQTALKETGLIEEIDFNDDGSPIEIEGINKEGNPKKGLLQKICITNLNLLSSTAVTKIWCVNLENDIPGISTSGKTTEVAFVVLQEKGSTGMLDIVLVELKTSLHFETKKDQKTKTGKIVDTFQQIEDKLKATMNRMYMLLTINNHDGKTIAVNFRGVICYNNDNDIDVTMPKPSRLCQPFLNKAKATETKALPPIEVILDCETISEIY